MGGEAVNMNDNNWLTILLDGMESEDQVCQLLDLSYQMTTKKTK